MKKALSILLAALALLIAVCPAMAEEPAAAETDTVVATVNGEALMTSALQAMEMTYLTEYAAMGIDVADEANLAYVKDLALTAAIEQMLTAQDMHAQGCYALEAETEAWVAEQGQLAYETALSDVEAMLRQTLEVSEETDLSEYALAYAAMLGVTVEDYADVYRTQIATVNYYAWLTQDCPVTEADVQAAFEVSGAEGELTQEVYDALASEIYMQRVQEKLTARVDVLAEAAEVVLH